MRYKIFTFLYDQQKKWLHVHTSLWDKITTKTQFGHVHSIPTTFGQNYFNATSNLVRSDDGFTRST